ncbi:uncharacterized protein AMSG_03390 [Thecamonas trahens ATCC 50062]|uniref:Uncharacterized protein n=1 Tax=Thecamonas trahens ATCC 50062 TaxID=461836 RepID=A0A0L0D3P4_THETB|nr:hypothetical protein AMSG_03390 [Thecamonas trahens ATCC 50062]KNC46957.1 hypothetical protein AMSG_03390 [Thecamonas trahens ATCC 50062]|eukprot:XP_013760228.1 hypothetical protein AMSG_03390 [Thecamonas trahens ATCC 50062]
MEEGFVAAPGGGSWALGSVLATHAGLSLLRSASVPVALTSGVLAGACGMAGLMIRDTYVAEDDAALASAMSFSIAVSSVVTGVSGVRAYMVRPRLAGPLALAAAALATSFYHMAMVDRLGLRVEADAPTVDAEDDDDDDS